MKILEIPKTNKHEIPKKNLENLEKKSQKSQIRKKLSTICTIINKLLLCRSGRDAVIDAPADGQSYLCLLGKMCR